MSKQETFAGVEVFEVGVRQLQQFISDGGLYRPVLNSAELLCVGTYAFVYKSEMFGGECASWHPVVLCGYVQGELELAIPPQVVELESCSIGRDVEIWRIVDDGNLWQAWDLEADAAAGDVLAAEAMEAVFGVDKYIQAPRCVVCKDAEYGPWVTVSLPIGARYMCEECFDAINTVRSVIGNVPLRIARCYS